MKISRPIAAASVGIIVASTLAACATGPADDAPATAQASPDENCTPEYEFTTLQDGIIQVAGMNELPGFLGNSADGPFEGFNATLMEEFAAANCLTVAWTPGTGPATQLLAADGKVDVWAGIIVANEKRAEVMNLEEQQLYFEFAGIASKQSDDFTSVSDLAGKRVGAVTGSNYVTPLQEAIGEGAVQLYQSSDEAYKDLSSGRLDAVLTPSTPQNYWVQQNAADELVSNIIEEDADHPVLTQAYQVVWPVNKANQELTDALSNYFAELTENGGIEEQLTEYGITDERHLTGR